MKRLTSLMLAALMLVTVMLAAPALAEEKLTITLASFPDQPKAALQAAIDAANLDFNVEIVEYPQNEYENKIKMAYGAGKATDLVLMDGPNIASYAVTGVLEPLNAYWDEEDYNDLVDSAKSTVSWNNQVWAAPLNESNTVLFYNKKIFDELGIVPPTAVEEAWSFEQLLEVCEKVTVPGQRYAIQPQMFSLANKNEGQTYTEMLWLWMGGGEVIAPDGSTATGYFDSAESKAGIRFYADLFAKGYATTEDIINAFETDRVAMWVNGPWCIGNWERDFPEVQWGVTPMPKGARSASGSGSWNIGMSASSQHKEEAWQVIQAITGKQGQAIWCDMTKNIPARASVMESDATYAEYPFNIIREQMLNNSMARPSTPAYPQISEALMDCFAEVAFGEDVDASVAKATQKMNEALAAVQ